MSKPTKSSNQTAKGLDRRSFFMMGGSAVATAAMVPLTGGDAEAAESDSEAKKARYKADSADVKNFYRVNRY
ncbi:MAG: hypothetical protein HY242_10295 [Afipia sp.]|nr:hypothetical protein [Afipia sp.]